METTSTYIHQRPRKTDREKRLQKRGKTTTNVVKTKLNRSEKQLCDIKHCLNVFVLIPFSLICARSC